MAHRRGTQEDPFKVGEQVIVLDRKYRFPLTTGGVIKRVIHPGRARAWIKYDVEFEWKGTTVIETRNATTLMAIEKKDIEVDDG